MLGIAALGLLIRVIYVVGWRTDALTGDALYYHYGANLLADGYGFTDPLRHRLSGVEVPGADHPPGYMVLLAIGSFVGLRSALAHQLISCMVGTCTVVAVGWTARRMVTPRAGLIAAAIAAVYPAFWMYDGMVLSETLILLTATITVLAALRAWEQLSVSRLAQLGAAVGVMALTRAESILLVVLIGVPMLWYGRARARTNLVLLGGVLALSTLAVVTPWVAYNLIRFDHPVTLAGTPEIALATSNCDAVYYGSNIGYWSEECAAKVLRGTPDDDALRARLLKDAGFTYVRGHMSRVPLVVFSRIGRTWGFYDPIGQMHLDEFVDGREALPTVLALVMFYALAASAIYGALVLRSRNLPIFFLVAFTLNVTVAVVALYGQTRFRAAAEPVIVLLAAAAFDRLWSRARPAAQHEIVVQSVERQAQYA